MKRAYLAVIGVAAVFALVLGCAKGYESEKTVDGLKVKLSVDRYPLVKGDNTLNVKVDNVAGAPLTDAKVKVRYYMPPMPGMAPMDYETEAVLKSGIYSITANIPMEGGWKVEVTVVRPGKASVTAVFNLDAR